MKPVFSLGSIRCAPLVLLLFAASATSPCPAATNPKQGAALLKTDILAVFAHPDDETGVAATLAHYALGRGAVVANVYATRGEGGGNMVGTHSGPALGLLREAELRDCLQTLGVRYCYFLDRLDWAYTESAAATLEKWNKKSTLEGLVRLVRALRPDVIITMNPAPNPGQHGHHQAAGILATEAFAAAADADRYPLQLSREGLTPWQVRKLFYSGGNTGVVTTIEVTQPLASGGSNDSPAEIAGRALANHRSQAFGNMAASPWLRRPQRFTLVKSFVPAGPNEATDLLSGLEATALVERLFPVPELAPVRIEFLPRPAVAAYRRWAAQHAVEHFAAQFAADLPVLAGTPNGVGLELVNLSATPIQGALQVGAPGGWKVEPTAPLIVLPAGTKKLMVLKVTPPADAAEDVEITASVPGAANVQSATAKLHPIPHGRVPRLESAPILEPAQTAWEGSASFRIEPHQVWQGKVANAADNSATFRLGHHGKTLYVDVEVKDDTIVSNIAPDDIKGHWRSDSVEICLDPADGAEHTLGCYKLGVFPFASTGRVRAARDADANQGPVEETAPGTRLASWRTADGYRIRAAIPFADIGLQPGQKRLGFNLLIYDGDKANAALGENINESRLAWAPRSGVMGRPEDWGRLELE